MHEFTIGFVPFGEVNTPKKAIDRRAAAALLALRELGYPIQATAPVTDDEAYADADRAVEELEQKPIDALVVCIAGWIPTHAVIRVIDRFRHVPMLLWSLAGWEENGKLISTADQAGATALSYTMRGMGYRYAYIYSIAGKALPMEEVGDRLAACYAAYALRDARIGSAGYRDMLLYGTMFDGMSLRRVVGTEVEPFELLEIVQEADKIPAETAADAVRFVRSAFVFETECGDEPIEKAARYALAIARRIRKRDYRAVTLVDVDGFKKLLGTPPAMIFMLLDRLCGVCVIPENDILGSVTQLMVRHLTGQSGTYLEFYEFFDDALLCGVPDFIPLEATLGEPTIHPAAFGLLSTSLLNVSKVRDGEVTLARLLYMDGKYTMHLERGTARQPRAWEECGWEPPAPQLPSLEIVPEGGVRAFADKVGSQHVIVAYGDATRRIRYLCGLLGIEIV
ncbi:MAG: hypothetical protein VB111_06975 [Clostridiaceae bacterium]|nr:hypothetical protein [Clostridiaceae bacterium]